MRNALAHVPKGQQTVVAVALRQAFFQTDQDGARKVWRQLADQLRPRWPRLSALMDRSEHDVLAYMGFPAQHQALHHGRGRQEFICSAVLSFPGTGDRVANSEAAAGSLAGLPDHCGPAALAAPVRLLTGMGRHCPTSCL